MAFDDELITLLNRDPRFVDDNGELLTAAIIDRAWKIDQELIKLLISIDEVKNKFFAEIEGHLVFNTNSFIDYISQRNFLDNSYTRFRNRIGLTRNDKYLASQLDDVVLSWAYKDCVLEGGQTKDDEKRDEILFNEVLAQDEINRLLAPKVLTNFVRYDAEGGNPVTELGRDGRGNINENLILKGNNLLCLHSLKHQLRGLVKLIYIDPPYNPPSNANTFVYNNNFNHSTWLTFMKNRLEVAKELLRKDGAMVVAIDDNERGYLSVLLRELFSEYEIHCITIVHNPRGIQGNNFSYTHEYAYFIIPKGRKTIGNRKIKPEDIDWNNLRNWGGESLRTDAKNCFYPVIVRDDEIIGFGDVLPEDQHPEKQTIQVENEYLIYPIDTSGVERKWRYARQSVDEIKHLLRTRKAGDRYEIELGKDFGIYKTVWEDPLYDANIYGTQLVNSLVPDCEFDFPKSLWNVYDCLYAVTAEDKDAIILDFFAGSGTTAHAVLELNKDGGNRKFILCEQMHYVEAVTKERVRRVIEENETGDFIYCELMKYNEIFMERIQEAESTDELLDIWKEVAEDSFLNWYVNPENPTEAISDFKEIGKEEGGLKRQKQLLFELLDKNQLYVNLSEINDTQFGVSSEDITLNKSFYEEEFDE